MREGDKGVKEGKKAREERREREREIKRQIDIGKHCCGEECD